MGLSPEKLDIVAAKTAELVKKLPTDLTSSQRVALIGLLSDTFAVAYNMGVEHHLETTQRLIQDRIDKQVVNMKEIIRKFDRY